MVYFHSYHYHVAVVLPIHNDIPSCQGHFKKHCVGLVSSPHMWLKKQESSKESKMYTLLDTVLNRTNHNSTAYYWLLLLSKISQIKTEEIWKSFSIYLWQLVVLCKGLLKLFWSNAPTPNIKPGFTAAVVITLHLCAVYEKRAEVSSPALTSLGPFLWQTFVSLPRDVCYNRLLTTSAVPSLHTAQILHTATFIATQRPEQSRVGATARGVHDK